MFFRPDAETLQRRANSTEVRHDDQHFATPLVILYDNGMT